MWTQSRREVVMEYREEGLWHLALFLLIHKKQQKPPSPSTQELADRRHCHYLMSPTKAPAKTGEVVPT